MNLQERIYIYNMHRVHAKGYVIKLISIEVEDTFSFVKCYQLIIISIMSV